jgi:hypothetical protein
MKWWERLIGIYYQPARVFEAMKQKPQWLLPLIIGSLVTVLVTVIILKPIVFPEQIVRINANPDIPDEAKQRAVEQMSGTLSYGLGIVTAAIAQPLVVLLIAVLLWGLFSMLGGRATFTGMFAATAWGGPAGRDGGELLLPAVGPDRFLHTVDAVCDGRGVLGVLRA